jgi:hypothetical protein
MPLVADLPRLDRSRPLKSFKGFMTGARRGRDVAMSMQYRGNRVALGTA